MGHRVHLSGLLSHAYARELIIAGYLYHPGGMCVGSTANRAGVRAVAATGSEIITGKTGNAGSKISIPT
jgi:hypothetical protein